MRQCAQTSALEFQHPFTSSYWSNFTNDLMNGQSSHDGPFHRCDNALFQQDPWLGGSLESLFGCPLRTHWQTQRPLVLLTSLKRVR